MECRFSVALLITCLHLGVSSCHTIISYLPPSSTGNTSLSPSLSCLACYNGQLGVNCVAFSNISEIPVTMCGQHQNFCKVRRLDTEGELTSLDRGCDEQCTPGCTDTGLYLECISCCTEHLCNTDNLASSMRSILTFWSWVTTALLLQNLV